MPRRQEVEGRIRELADGFGLPADLIIRQCEAESAFRQDAVSPCGAIGLMQLMPATAKHLGVDPNNWRENIEGGMRFMFRLMLQFGGDQARALAAYNCGPGRLSGIIKKYGDAWRDHLPTETKNYLRRILA